jgi:O-antigen ligase
MLDIISKARDELVLPDDPSPALVSAIGALIAVYPLSLFGLGLADVVGSSIAVLVLIHSALKRDFGWAREPWLLVGFLVWVYLVVRGLLSVRPAESGLSAAIWIRFLVMAAALHVFLPRSPALQRLLLFSGLTMAAFGAVDALVQWSFGQDLLGRPLWDNVRLTGPLRIPAIGFMILFGGMSAIVFLMSRIMGRNIPLTIRMASAATLLVIFAAIALSGERMPFVQAGITLGVVFLLAPTIRALLLTGTVGVATLATLLLLAPNTAMRQASVVEEVQKASVSNYGQVMWAGVDIATDNPVFGVGLKNFREACPLYIEPEHRLGCDFNHPHHLWIQLAAETGLIGLIGFTAIFVLALRPALPHLRNIYDRPLLSGSTLAILILFFPIMTFGNFFTNWRASLIWFLIGVAAALGRAPAPSRRPA